MAGLSEPPTHPPTPTSHPVTYSQPSPPLPVSVLYDQNEF